MNQKIWKTKTIFGYLEIGGDVFSRTSSFYTHQSFLHTYSFKQQRLAITLFHFYNQSLKRCVHHLSKLRILNLFFNDQSPHSPHLILILNN